MKANIGIKKKIFLTTIHLGINPMKGGRPLKDIINLKNSNFWGNLFNLT